MGDFQILLKDTAVHRAAGLRSVIGAVVVILAVVSDLSISNSAWAQMRGHGGPVRALAISPDGKIAISGSFDTTIISWSLARNIAELLAKARAA